MKIDIEHYIESSCNGIVCIIYLLIAPIFIFAFIVSFPFYLIYEKGFKKLLEEGE